MGYQVTQGRIKEKYRPVPNAAEARHEARLREDFPCYGCGGPCECLHHTMLRFPQKRWDRRDHRYQLPLCNGCHLSLHKGREPDWLERVGRDEAETIEWLVYQWEASELIERMGGR